MQTMVAAKANHAPFEWAPKIPTKLRNAVEDPTARMGSFQRWVRRPVSAAYSIQNRLEMKSMELPTPAWIGL